MPSKHPIPTNPRFRDITGNRFGRFTVEYFAGRSKSNDLLWYCRCDCGVGKVIRGGHLVGGRSLSCGCFRAETVGSWSRTHGSSRTAEHRTWIHLIGRCTNPNDESFKHYGGRGIRVCKRWRENFAAFLSDMGKRPRGMTIERIDNNGDYEPGNCRWATQHDQSRNQRSNVVISFAGRKMIAADWARELGMDPIALRRRIHNGWTPERALNQPSKRQ